MCSPRPYGWRYLGSSLWYSADMNGSIIKFCVLAASYSYINSQVRTSTIFFKAAALFISHHASSGRHHAPSWKATHSPIYPETLGHLRIIPSQTRTYLPSSAVSKHWVHVKVWSGPVLGLYIGRPHSRSSTCMHHLQLLQNSKLEEGYATQALKLPYIGC